MFSSVDLSLSVQNNVNYPVQINVLGNPYNLLDTANATTEYRWNFTSFTFSGETQIIIQYKLNSETSFTTYSGQLGSQTLQAIVDVLNGLNIGYFNLYTESGSTYIGTYNDNYTYGQINVFSSTSLVNPNFFVGNGFSNTVGGNFANNGIAIQNDGKILFTGTFVQYNGISTFRLARLNTDGSLDTTFNIGNGFNNLTNAVAIQPDGKIIVGGSFTTFNGISANKIVRLNTDGSIDNTFVYGTAFTIGFVNSIALQSDGKIIVGGAFGTYDGNTANRIVRLNTNGSIDGTFVTGTGFNLQVNQIAIQSDGNILAVGNFTSYNGTGANRIIRLNSTGGIDGTFVYGSGFNNNLETINIQQNGNVVCGGDFTSYNGTTANRVIRLTSTGLVDTSFVYGSGFDGPIQGFGIQNDGKIIVIGNFNTYQGVNYTNIVRLNTDGSIDTSWNVGTGFSGGNPQNIALNSSLAYIGGSFNSFDSPTFNYSYVICLNQ